MALRLVMDFVDKFSKADRPTKAVERTVTLWRAFPPLTAISVGRKNRSKGVNSAHGDETHSR